MLLKDILYKVPIISVSGSTDCLIKYVSSDSRAIQSEFLFVAIKGTQVDGHQFIDQAVVNGAAAVVCETIPEKKSDGITYIQVKDAAYAFGIVSSNYFGSPSEKIQVVAVTGTNGKTTTATLLYQLFKDLKYSVGLLSTVHNKINDHILPSTHTTPDAWRLNELLRNMVDEGCDYCFMEASSHAIVQHRIAGIRFAGAIFTNITHDHLDYHGTFEAYIEAKKKLFDGLPSSAFALVNVDDKRGLVMLQNTKATKKTYSLKNPSDYKAKIISDTLEGLELYIDHRSVWFRLIGKFNAYNLMAVYATAILLGQDAHEVLTVLSRVAPAPGRFEQLLSPSHTIGIIDYAHTPDALENVLKTIHSFKGNQQVITVVGCGGNRDASKRPIMGSIACKWSDHVIFTSDNPRHESPDDIIQQMKSGVSITDMKKVLTIVDRKEAIKTACVLAKPYDIILVAGKGHETYQEVKGIKYPFDDKQVLQELFAMLSK